MEHRKRDGHLGARRFRIWELDGAPAITLDDWFRMPRDERGGFAH